MIFLTARLVRVLGVAFVDLSTGLLGLVGDGLAERVLALGDLEIPKLTHCFLGLGA